LTAQGEAKPGWNIVKIAIGDVGDGNLDSWVLLEAGSFSCALGDAPKSFEVPETVEVTPIVSTKEIESEIETEAESETETETETESGKASPQKMSAVAKFFILVVALFVLGWVLFASGALRVKKVSNRVTTIVPGKPSVSQLKMKSIEWCGAIKAKSIETYGKVKAKSSEKFGSKKVNPDESTASSPGKAKAAEQEPKQQVEENV